MAAAYSRDLAKVAVAKILQTIGWHSANATPLEILTDVLVQYIAHLGRATNDYANEFGVVEPNLDHLGLVFRDFHISLPDLEDYCRYVNFGQGPTVVPKYPLPKEDHLNFLKPGSKEVVTRPVHIHEHLPPMYPLLEVAENEGEEIIKTEEQQQQPEEQVTNNENVLPVFKKPADIPPTGETFKRPRLVMEEEGRPTREISSVLMTASGFLSPAREGKLPESRTPLAAVETAPPNNPSPLAVDPVKKPTKIVKRIEKKKFRIGRELFKPEDRVKKTTMKDIVKLKQMKAAALSGAPLPNSPLNMMLNSDLKISPIANNKLLQPNAKVNKALVAARQKTEKLNTTITPIPMRPSPTPQTPMDNVDKLFTEPDKKKVNILKKISNVNKEKPENKVVKLKDEKPESRESSPGLIIDDKVETPPKVPHISDDITIELVPCPAPTNNTVPEKTERQYFDESPPGTPSTPKTPEMISQSPPLPREKRKRKDKSKVKKVQKLSPARVDSDEIIDIIADRPKTPEAQVVLKPEQPPASNQPSQRAFPFIRNFCGPGLIPPLNNPLYQPLPFPQFMHGFGQNPYMPSPHLPPFLPQTRQEEPPPKVQEKLPPPITIEEDTQQQQPPPPPPQQQQQQQQQQQPQPQQLPLVKLEKKLKEHKKEKKDKIKKKNKKDKMKNKAEKRKLKEERKEKIKKEKKEKRKDKELQLRGENEIALPKLTLKLGSASPCPPENSQDTKKLNIKPIVKKEEEEEAPPPPAEVKRELMPELAKISALVTGQPKPKVTTTPPNSNLKEEHGKEESVAVAHHQSLVPRAGPGPGRPRVHPIKPKPAKIVKQQLPVKDAEGNEVWICPACGKQDDGSPMIGCDDCDAWYHWVCVNIQVAPAHNEDWYCRLCLVKKQEALQSDKKKKRKKREKKEH